MSDFGIETPEEQRAHYLRLARAATEAAAKSPSPGAEEMYVKLAQAWVAMADENDAGPEYFIRAPSGHRSAGRLNVKLNGMP